MRYALLSFLTFFALFFVSALSSRKQQDDTNFEISENKKDHPSQNTGDLQAIQTLDISKRDPCWHKYSKAVQKTIRGAIEGLILNADEFMNLPSLRMLLTTEFGEKTFKRLLTPSYTQCSNQLLVEKPGSPFIDKLVSYFTGSNYLNVDISYWKPTLMSDFGRPKAEKFFKFLLNQVDQFPYGYDLWVDDYFPKLVWYLLEPETRDVLYKKFLNCFGISELELPNLEAYKNNFKGLMEHMKAKAFNKFFPNVNYGKQDPIIIIEDIFEGNNIEILGLMSKHPFYTSIAQELSENLKLKDFILLWKRRLQFRLTFVELLFLEKFIGNRYFRFFYLSHQFKIDLKNDTESWEKMVRAIFHYRFKRFARETIEYLASLTEVNSAAISKLEIVENDPWEYYVDKLSNIPIIKENSKSSSNHDVLLQRKHVVKNLGRSYESLISYIFNECQVKYGNANDIEFWKTLAREEYFFREFDSKKRVKVEFPISSDDIKLDEYIEKDSCHQNKETCWVREKGDNFK